jgi:hypothetical protein
MKSHSEARGSQAFASPAVAAGLRPAVEGGILPPGPGVPFAGSLSKGGARPAGQDARLYGRVLADSHHVRRYGDGDAAQHVPAGSDAE